jgi:hypothetical protein
MPSPFTHSLAIVILTLVSPSWNASFHYRLQVISLNSALLKKHVLVFETQLKYAVAPEWLHLFLKRK